MRVERDEIYRLDQLEKRFMSEHFTLGKERK